MCDIMKSTNKVLKDGDRIYFSIYEFLLRIDKCFIVVSGSQIETTNKIVKSIVKDFTVNFICIIISFVRVLRISRNISIQCDEVIIMAFVWRPEESECQDMV